MSVLAATHPDQPRAPQLVREYVRYGGSPRGAQALVTAGKIFALLDGRFNVSIDDIRAVALPALRHRLILNFEGEAEGITTEAVVRAILDAVAAADRRVARAGAHPMSDDRPAAVAERPARQAFLPTELDPTVFDEAFLRQLERLLLLMRAPVRGGLKGGRRSVKRGQSVEFADYRDYTLGDDLRQLDWNVLRPARAALRQALRRGGGRHGHAPRRRQRVDGRRPSREAPVRQAGGRRARLHRARVRGQGRGLRARRTGGPPAGRPARLRAGLPAAHRAERRSRSPTARRTSSRRPATRRPSSAAGA